MNQLIDIHMTSELINTPWIHYKNGKRYVIAFIGKNPNGRTNSKIIGYVDKDMNYWWRSEREFMKKFTRERGTFKNFSKHMWNEETCRNMIAAVALYYADQNGGRLTIDAQKLIKAAEKMGHVMLSLSDDDKTLTITGANTQ